MRDVLARAMAAERNERESACESATGSGRRGRPHAPPGLETAYAKGEEIGVELATSTTTGDLDEKIIRLYATFDDRGRATGDVALVAGQTIWQDCETTNSVTSIDEEVEDAFRQTWVRVCPDMDAVLVHSNAYDTILVANGAQPALSVDPEVFRSFVKTSDNWADWGSPKSWAEHGDTIGEAAPKYGEIVAFYDGRELTVVDPDRWAERRLYYGADRIDIDEYATTYEDASGNAFEAFQIPWTEVTRILRYKHTCDWEQDQALIRALRAAGAPDWIEEFEGGWCDEYGWGIFGPAKP